MPAQVPHELEQQISNRLDSLHRELGPQIPRDHLTSVGRYHAERLLAQATITDYIPLLVYRCTKEDSSTASRYPNFFPSQRDPSGRRNGSPVSRARPPGSPGSPELARTGQARSGSRRLLVASRAASRSRAWFWSST